MEALRDITLVLHSAVRWLVLFAAFWAVFIGVRGYFGKRAWGPSDALPGNAFATLTTLQLLFGLVLYLSFGWFGEAWRSGSSTTARFFGIEHLVLGLVAVALAHAGRAAVGRATTDQQRYFRAALWYTLALIAVLLTIPWPFLPYGRPLFRLTA
jgi:hypothetical protein